MTNPSTRVGLVGLISIWFRTKSLNLGHPKPKRNQSLGYVKLMSKQIATGNIYGTTMKLICKLVEINSNYQFTHTLQK